MEVSGDRGPGKHTGSGGHFGSSGPHENIGLVEVGIGRDVQKNCSGLNTQGVPWVRRSEGVGPRVGGGEGFGVP